jgi:tetratricopeptide (TPR) repeat protein
VQETSLLLRLRKMTTLLLVVVLGISLLAFRQTLATPLYQNLGYIHLTRDLLSPTSNRADLASAQRLFTASLGWQRGNSRARWGLGQAHHRLGEDGAAVGEWRLGEGALSRLLTLSDAAFEAEEYGEALTQALLAVQVDPNSSSAHYRLGEAHRALGELETALAEYENAKELNSFLPGDEADMASCYFGEARVYEAQENWNAAVWHYEAGLQLRPDAAAYGAVGTICHYVLADEVAAESYLLRALELEPGQVWWHIELGNVYLRQERYGDALAQHMEALQVADDPAQMTEVYEGLGRSYYGMGQFEEAASMLEEAVREDPHNDSARERLEDVLHRVRGYDGSG